MTVFVLKLLFSMILGAFLVNLIFDIGPQSTDGMDY